MAGPTLVKVHNLTSSCCKVAHESVKGLEDEL